MDIHAAYRALIDSVKEKIVQQAIERMKADGELDEGKFGIGTVEEYIPDIATENVNELLDDIRTDIEEDDRDLIDVVAERLISKGYECMEE